MLSYAKSATTRPEDRLNGLKNSKTQLFNTRGVVKLAYFQKKWSVSLSQTCSGQSVLIFGPTFLLEVHCMKNLRVGHSSLYFAILTYIN